MEEIINKVANSSLQVFDLEDYYVSGIRTQLDISQWLYEGFLLKEKDFREALKNHDWSQYQNHFVSINQFMFMKFFCCKTFIVIFKSVNIHFWATKCFLF